MRTELKALGLTDETIEAVMKHHGEHIAKIEECRKTAEEQRDKALTKLKGFQKGGSDYIDPEEHNRLKAFEKETLSKAIREKKTAALMKLYKSANVSESAAKLLIRTRNLDEVEVDDKDEVVGGGELLKADQADYADLFSATGNAGAPHVPDEESGSSTTNARKKIY